MGNTNKSIYDTQMQIIQEKLHNPSLNLNFDDNKLLSITDKTALELQKDLLKKSLSLEEIFKVYHYAKMKENNEHNCFTDVLYEKPLQRAQYLDQELKKGKLNATDKPLLGFIMSIKDSNKLKGTTCVNGFAINIGKVEEKQPKLIQHLINCGAIITCKGNVPMALFSMESVNHVFGAAKNPYDPLRTVGGSSGGEAALIALGLVNASIGSDTAGSLRIPANFCGIVAFKPTINRVSNEIFSNYFYKQDFAETFPDRQQPIRSTIGPMARNVGDCLKLMRVMIEGSKFDKLVPPLEWRKAELPKRIGVFTQFSQFPVCESYKRALKEASTVLQNKGIEIVEIDLDDLFEDILINSAASFYKNDALIKIVENKAPIGEPLIRAFKDLNLLFKFPTVAMKGMAWKEGSSMTGIMLKGIIKGRTVNRATITNDMNSLFERYVDRLAENDVEILLAPGMVTPAVFHGSSNENKLQAVYQFMFSTLEVCTGAMPITKVREDEQYYESDKNDIIINSIKLNMENSKGLPIGIQVSGLPWTDEKVFKVMEVIEQGVNYVR